MAAALRHEYYQPSAKRTFATMLASLQANARQTLPQNAPIRTVTTSQVEQPTRNVAAAKRGLSEPRFEKKVEELPNAVLLMAADLERRQHLLVSHINRTLPAGCHVLAWGILPKQVFQGELGRFLMMACDFYACGPENTLLLPAMPQGVQHLNLPRHPLVVSDTHVTDSIRRVQQLHQTVLADHERATRALQAGDLSQLFKSSERQTTYRKQLLRIAADITDLAFGQHVRMAHDLRFRSQIQCL